jgi:hypothetical protein
MLRALRNFGRPEILSADLGAREAEEGETPTKTFCVWLNTRESEYHNLCTLLRAAASSAYAS